MSVIWIRLRSEQSTIIAWHNKKTIGKSARVEGGSYRFTSHNLHHFFFTLHPRERMSHALHITTLQMRIPETSRDDSHCSALPRSSKALSHVGVRLSSSATAPQAPASRPARRNGLSASGSPWSRLAIKFETTWDYSHAHKHTHRHTHAYIHTHTYI